MASDAAPRFHAASRQPRDSRGSVKPRIKAQDSLDSVVFHDGQMHRITRRYLSMPHHNFLGALCCGQINGQRLIGNTEQSVERRLDGVPTIDRDIALQYLLEDLGIGYQALSIPTNFSSHCCGSLKRTEAIFNDQFVAELERRTTPPTRAWTACACCNTSARRRLKVRDSRGRLTGYGCVCIVCL
jgi:hypothetical protein